MSVPHRSDSFRSGALWRFPLWGGFFTEGFFGGAYDDGSLAGDATHTRSAATGCSTPVVRSATTSMSTGASSGRSTTFSNGKTAFGTGFKRNVGVNDWGLQVSYAF